MRVVDFTNGEPVPEGSAAVPAIAAELSADAFDGELDFPLVLVTWHDAWFDFDQTSPDDCRPDYLVRTVGFLVSERPRVVSIAQELLPDGDGFRAVTHIPTSVIDSVTPLEQTWPDLEPEPGA